MGNVKRGVELLREILTDDDIEKIEESHKEAHAATII